MLGVLVNHMLDGLLHAAVLDTNSPLRGLNFLLYIFRMPAFAFVIGLFIPAGVARRGTVAYLAQRAALGIWLYLLWTVIFVTADVLAPGKNHDREISPIRLMIPGNHLWFLGYLVVGTALVVLLRVWDSGIRGRLGLGAAIAATLLLWHHDSPVIGLSGLYLIGFTALGARIGVDRLNRWVSGHGWRWALLGAAGGAASWGLWLLGARAGALPEVTTAVSPTPAIVRLVLSVASACAGVVGVIGVAVVLERRSRLRGPLSYFGQHTLPVYLAHVLFAAGMRVALLAMGITSPIVHLVLGIAAGVLAPLALAAVIRRIGWGFLFAVPAWLRTRLPGGQAPSRTLRHC